MLEVKIVISVDENTKNLIEGITAAIIQGLGSKKIVDPEGTWVPGGVELEVEHVKTKGKKAKIEVLEEIEDEEEETHVPSKKTSKKEKSKPLEEDETKYTVDDVRKALAEAKHRGNSIDKCKSVLGSFGYKGVSEVEAEDFAEIIKALAKI